MSIINDLQDSIAANLPAAVASELSKYIEEAEKQKINIKALTRLYEDEVDSGIMKEKDILSLNNKIIAQDILSEREEDLVFAEEEFRIRNSALKEEILKIKLLESEKRNALMEGLVGKVFGHPSVTISNVKDSPIMADINTGNSQFESGRVSETNSTVTSKSKI